MNKSLCLISLIILGMVGCQNHSKNTGYFKDNGYQADTVHISGQVLNFPEGKTLQVSYTKFVEDEHVKLQFTPDSMGNFEMRIPVINSTRLYLYYFMQGDIVTLFAEPGEKIVIHSDWEKKTLAFSGEHAQSHQEVYDYGRYVDSLSLPRPYGSYFDERISHEECLRLLTVDWTQNDSLLNVYRQVRPEMSERAVAQVQAMNQNNFAFKLMQRRFVLDRRKKEAFSAEYMQKADSIYNRLTRPYTLSDVV